MKIIGITGTLGAGKGTVADYLVKKKKYLYFSVRAFLVEEIIKRSMEVCRESMVLVANDLREKFGSSYIVDQLINRAKESSRDVVIESVRSVGEAESLKKNNAILISVDANQRLRYDRIVARESETDAVSFEQFVFDEEKEMTSTDSTKQNISAVMQMADMYIINNGTLEELREQIEVALTKM